MVSRVFSVKFKARRAAFLRRSGELITRDIRANTLSTTFVFGVLLLGGGEGDLVGLLVGVLGGEEGDLFELLGGEDGGVFVFLRLGVLAIYYIQMYLLWVNHNKYIF